MPKSGIEFKFYGQYINNAQKENPLVNLTEFRDIDQPISSSNLFFGFGIKKRLGIPVSGRKYQKLRVSVFKDLNGNGRQDKNEAGLKNVLVNIKPVRDSLQRGWSEPKETGEDFITNEDGLVTYKNIPKGIYKISIVPLASLNGFFAGNEQAVMVDKDLTFAMPLNKGVQLTGGIIVNRDVTAADFDKQIDVSKIRVTAMDSLGRTFSTLTDNGGRFSLRLPGGVYQISINEKALPDNFDLEQKRITVEMFTVAENYNVTFLLEEKKRKKNIKKFDQDGKLIETNAP
jgi:hypothetical protein